MAERSLSLACDLNLLTWPVYDETLKLDGVNLDFQPPDNIVEMFNRVIRTQAFECAEMSMASYMMACDQGRPAYTAVPVFPSRVFRHGFVFVDGTSGVSEPADLVGADVGVPSYTMTAALWARGVLQHEYGLYPGDVT